MKKVRLFIFRRCVCLVVENRVCVCVVYIGSVLSCVYRRSTSSSVVGQCVHIRAHQSHDPGKHQSVCGVLKAMSKTQTNNVEGPCLSLLLKAS